MEKHDISYKGKLKFISHYEPPLEAGRYSLEVTQKIKNFEDPDETEESVGGRQEFIVSAPRFNLDNGDIFSLYPPKGGQADYDGVVASISFSRSTLPWERSPSKVDKRDGAAWLALLLVDEDELESGKAREVYADEKERTRYRLQEMKPWLNLDGLEKWDRYDPDMPLRVLEISDELRAIVPTYGDLKWLSHARQNINEAGEVTSSLGTVLCNRVPTPGKSNTVYLVSVEERYATSEDACEAECSNGHEGKQRLVFLHKWRFYCREAELYGYTVTPEILLDAAREDDHIRYSEPLPDWVGVEYDGEEGREELKKQVVQWLRQGPSSAEWMTDRAAAIVAKGRHQEGTFSEILENVRVSLLQDAPEHGQSVSPAAQQMLDCGHTALKHHLRAGGKTYSWLKGALAPRELGDMGFSFPAKSADDLLIFHRDTGMFDASYAAAWSLGRLKGMENKAVSIALFRWRHEQLHAQVSHQHAHLHVEPLPDSPLPEEVVEQVEAWKLLQGIPFEYLVPHPKLLPNESLRFFHLDTNWMRCFIDGFFSVAKVHGLSDFRKEQALFPAFDRPITGVLLRSNAVAGWPSMHVNAYQEAMEKNETDLDARHLCLLRKERLQSEVLLLLFDGVPRTFDLYLSPEGLHSGFEREDTRNASPRYTHRVRHPATGVEIESLEEVEAIANSQGSQMYRTFSAKALEQKFQEKLEKSFEKKVKAELGREFSPGDFGLQLIRGSQLVRYQLGLASV